jgi:UDP-glucose 4-epimerase
MNDESLVVVTGGAGFIGSNLCSRLLSLGFKVISLDNYFTGKRTDPVPGVDYREGHTKDIEKHIPEMPSLLYHLGEYSRVEVSLTEPDIVWDLNIAGTFGVVEFWRKRRPKLIYAGSSTKYADGGMGRDQSPYSFTKAFNSVLVSNYAEWYSLPYATTYFYNVYGPGERSGKYGTVIEIFRQRYLRGEALLINSPGTQRRNFTHVDDIVDGLILVGQKGDGDEFGLGNEKSYSILEIAQLFAAPIDMRPEVKGNRMSAKLDATKSYALGWHAKMNVEDYIKDIINQKKSRGYTLNKEISLPS